MMRKLILLLLFVGLGAVGSFGQKAFNWLPTRKAVASLKEAQVLIRQQKYSAARAKLKETIRTKPDFAVAHRELGKVNLLTENFEEAVKHYERSFELNSRFSRAAYFECGEAYFKLGNFEKARLYFSTFTEMRNTRYTNKRREEELEAEHDKKLLERLRNYEFAKNAMRTPLTNTPVNVGAMVNSPQDEYLPTVSGDGNVMIFTTEKTFSTTEKPSGENIFYSTRQRKQDAWQQAVGIGSDLNTYANEGMAKFCANERFFYFAGCERPDSYGGCDIYELFWENYEVRAVNHLIGGVNSEVWDSQPSITCDGKTMFFTSNRAGGKGGSDIWTSHLQPNGVWSDAVNLTALNTTGDEESPFVAPDGRTLYFASTGHDGMGDGDIFVTRLAKATADSMVWTTPMNLGFPINSQFQEVGLYLMPNGYTAYFASSRRGGIGKLDIYEVELPPQFQPADMVLLEGRVTDDLTGEAINTTVRVSHSTQKWEVKTGKDGWYFICLPAGKAYAFQVNEEKDYEYFMEAAYLSSRDNSIPFRFDISLIRKELPSRADEPAEPDELHYNIYFDFDEHAINDKAQAQLKDLATKLQSEPHWEVEIIGYTDNVGNAAYNKLLSEQRARAVVTFLSINGVVVEKVRQEGRGSVSTAAVDTEEARKKSRRVEVILRK